MIGSHHSIETIEIGIEIEKVKETIAIGIKSMMIAGIEEIEVGPEIRIEVIIIIKNEKRMLKFSPNPRLLKFPWLSKSLCPPSLAKEDNVVNDNVPALH